MQPDFDYLLVTTCRESLFFFLDCVKFSDLYIDLETRKVKARAGNGEYIFCNIGDYIIRDELGYHYVIDREVFKEWVRDLLSYH